MPAERGAAAPGGEPGIPPNWLQGREPVLLACDFDGTLAELTPRPEQARLAPNNRLLLEQLAAGERVRVAIVSGRRLEDLERALGDLPAEARRRLYLVGDHGLTAKGPGLRWEHPTAAAGAAALDEVCTAVASELRRGGWPGVRLERKRFTAAIHYREAQQDLQADPAGVAESLRRMLEVRLRQHPGLQLRPGKCVWEIRPRLAWGKGAAVKWLEQNVSPPGKPFAGVIYIGDDETDEDVFRSFHCDCAGRYLGLRVVDEERDGHYSAADFTVPGTAAVTACLCQLADWFGQGGRRDGPAS